MVLPSFGPTRYHPLIIIIFFFLLQHQSAAPFRDLKVFLSSYYHHLLLKEEPRSSPSIPKIPTAFDEEEERESNYEEMNIFNKKPTAAKDAMRENKREMAHATRGIEREISSLQLEEKRLVAEIKRTAKTGNETATKILARQLVRLRQQIANLQASRAQMRGIATHTQAMHAQSSIAVGMKGAVKAMSAMNKQMEPAKQMKMIQEFQRQSAQMDMTTEMMSDTIDGALDNDEAEDETEELTNQVLDEIGVDVVSQLSAAPRGKIAGKKTEDVDQSDIDELEKRLVALRNA